MFSLLAMSKPEDRGLGYQLKSSIHSPQIPFLLRTILPPFSAAGTRGHSLLLLSRLFAHYYVTELCFRTTQESAIFFLVNQEGLFIIMVCGLELSGSRF